jgi:hypothetical protein
VPDLAVMLLARAKDPDPERACACGCGDEIEPGNRPGKRFVDDRHRKRQHRRDERAEHRELKAAAKAAELKAAAGAVTAAELPAAAEVHGGASVTTSVTAPFRSTATVGR